MTIIKQQVHTMQGGNHRGFGQAPEPSLGVERWWPSELSPKRWLELASGRRGGSRLERSPCAHGASFPQVSILLCRAIFLFSTIFLLPEGLPFTFLVCGSVGDEVL